jgi:hypothetical protein
MNRTLSFLFLFALISFLLLSCSRDASGPTGYERIVIDSYKSASYVGDPEIDLFLYDDSGNELAKDDYNGAGSIDTHTEGLVLDPGVYYIKVDDTYAAYTGPYALRVLSLAVGDSLPAAEDPNSIPDDSGNESDDSAPGNIPDNPVDIPLGNSNWVNRYLDSATGDVADWFKLVLP